MPDNPRRSGLMSAFGLALLAISATASLAGEIPPPKYGPAAVRLVEDRRYIQRHEAPDFWALIGYYLPQRDERSCSVASAAMLLNALRVEHRFSAADELVTQDGLLEKVDSDAWDAGVAPGGEGVSLDELGDLVRQALDQYGLDGYRVEVVPCDKTGPDALKRLRRALAENETSGRDVIIANFRQDVFTGDPERAVGHMAPIAAYDAEARAALVLDPDRRWYEPYWISDERLLEGMATPDDVTGRPRGYLWVRPEE